MIYFALTWSVTSTMCPPSTPVTCLRLTTHPRLLLAVRCTTWWDSKVNPTKFFNFSQNFNFLPIQRTATKMVRFNENFNKGIPKGDFNKDGDEQTNQLALSLGLLWVHLGAVSYFRIIANWLFTLATGSNSLQLTALCTATYFVPVLFSGLHSFFLLSCLHLKLQSASIIFFGNDFYGTLRWPFFCDDCFYFSFNFSASNELTRHSVPQNWQIGLPRSCLCRFVNALKIVKVVKLWK